MRLYSYFRSSASYRVRIALNLKRLDYTLETLHLRLKAHRAPDYLKLNPQGLVPALAHEGKVLSQSLAIIEYLDEIAPQPPLLPMEPAARAIVRSMAQLIASEMHPLCNLRVLQYLKGPLGHDDAAVNAWYRHWMAEGFMALEGNVREHSGDGRHCYGRSVTLADICLVPQVYNAERFGCDLAAFPTVLQIARHLAEQPAFYDARPEAQPDAE